MQFHNLKSKTKRKRAKQVGRGGTRGKTAGRGTKGQNARAGHKKRPEMRDIIKRVPKLRGRGKSSLKSFRPKAKGRELQTLLANKKTKKDEVK
ncbi:MAG: uL15 family ribosomal protein [Candidatus Zambryskibacteria bacterium]|nr:uL15 family ribosomal protein [Candidatus Zambryskibacteria bacterium]